MAGNSEARLGKETWVQASFVVVLLTVPVVLWTKFGSIDTALGVNATEVKHLREGQTETNATLREIANKIDGERLKLGEHGGRIALLEQAYQAMDQRVRELERKAENK